MIILSRSWCKTLVACLIAAALPLFSIVQASSENVPLNQVPYGRGPGISRYKSGPMQLGITRAQIATNTIIVDAFIVSGFATSGDLGAGAVYTSVGATSGGIGAIQDATGTWYNLTRGDENELNVGWFGAKGDGVTDDNVAVQAAFTAAESTASSVYFPASTFKITHITTTKPVTFFGSSRLRSIINATDPTKDVIVFDVLYTNIGSFSAHDLTINGGANGLLVQNAVSADIKDLNFNNQTEASVWAGTNSFQWDVRNCQFNGGRYNIKFLGTGNGSVPINKTIGTGPSGQLSKLSDNWYIAAKQIAIYASGAEGLSISNGYLELVASDNVGGNPAWASTMNYTAGNVVNINAGAAKGYVYRSTVGGISGGSVPTSTSRTVTDGSVTWEVLGRRAGIWVDNNQGLYIAGMQSERISGTVAIVLNGTSNYSFSTRIIGNAFRQTYPAAVIEINNENRIFLIGNHFIDTGPWFSIPAASTVKGMVLIGNIYQLAESIAGTLSIPIRIGNEVGNSSGAFAPENAASFLLDPSGVGIATLFTDGGGLKIRYENGTTKTIAAYP